MRVHRVALYLATIACLTVPAAGQPAAIMNGGFESGFTSWENRGDGQINTERSHGGVKHAVFGKSKRTNPGRCGRPCGSNSAVEPTLSFWLLVTSN